MKWAKRAAYVILALLLLGQAPAIVEGFLLSPGFLTVCFGFPLGVISALYLVVRFIYALSTRTLAGFWSKDTAIALLFVLWGGAPLVIMPGHLPHLAGYYLRAKTIADVPAILAWADSYARSAPPGTQPAYESEMIPEEALPDAVRKMGTRAFFDRNDRTIEIINGGALPGHWGLTVGHGVSLSPQYGTRWTVSDDAFVWDHE
jgi:hypothetical protein